MQSRTHCAPPQQLNNSSGATLLVSGGGTAEIRGEGGASDYRLTMWLQCVLDYSSSVNKQQRVRSALQTLSLAHCCLVSLILYLSFLLVSVGYSAALNLSGLYRRDSTGVITDITQLLLELCIVLSAGVQHCVHVVQFKG